MILRLGTYNVRNLVSLGEASRRETDKHRRLLVAVGVMLRRADAHFMGLQEVGDDDVLERLNQEVLRGRYAYRHVARGNDESCRGLAVLSQLPWIDVLSHRQAVLRHGDGQPLLDADGHGVGFRRDFLRLRLRLRLRPHPEVETTEPLTIFIAHFKSALPLNAAQFSFDAAAYRRAEARAAAEIVETYVVQHPQAPVVVLGDFNDEERSASTVSPLIDDLGFFDPVRHEFPARADRWTASWKAFGRRRFDFVLLSPSLRPCYRPGSATIHRQIPAGRASDHRPVTVELDLSLLPGMKKRRSASANLRQGPP